VGGEEDEDGRMGTYGAGLRHCALRDPLLLRNVLGDGAVADGNCVRALTMWDAIGGRAVVLEAQALSTSPSPALREISAKRALAV
jgi:hypothetical protein